MARAQVQTDSGGSIAMMAHTLGHRFTVDHCHLPRKGTRFRRCSRIPITEKEADAVARLMTEKAATVLS